MSMEIIFCWFLDSRIRPVGLKVDWYNVLKIFNVPSMILQFPIPMQLRKSLIYRKSVRMLIEQLKGKSSLTTDSITKKKQIQKF